MKRERRLRRSKEYDAVYKEGKVASGPLILARARTNGLDYSRVGFVVGRRVGGAVTRNRVRRRLRELARQAPITPGFDVVFYARPATANASFLALAKAVSAALSRVKIWGTESFDRPMAGFPVAW